MGDYFGIIPVRFGVNLINPFGEEDQTGEPVIVKDHFWSDKLKTKLLNYKLQNDLLGVKIY